jgi:hypothetical protein
LVQPAPLAGGLPLPPPKWIAATSDLQQSDDHDGPVFFGLRRVLEIELDPRLAGLCDFGALEIFSDRQSHTAGKKHSRVMAY